MGQRIAGVSFLLDAMLVIKHQQGIRQRLGSGRRTFGIIKQIDQRLDIVTAEHGAQQFSGANSGDQRRLRLAFSHCGQKCGLDIGRLIDPGGDPVGQQIEQKGFFAFGGIFEQHHQIGGLLDGQRQGGNALGGAFGGLLAIIFEHGESPLLA